MNIDFNNISNTYGEDIIINIKDNIDNVMENIDYLKRINIDFADELFELYSIIFIGEPSLFREKINALIKELGDNYVDIISDNMFVFEKLL